MGETAQGSDRAAANYCAQSAYTGTQGHLCHCIGCCSKCGTCRTWPGHTRDYCELLRRQAAERAHFIGAEENTA